LRDAVVSDAPAVAACVNAAYAQWIPVIGRKPWPMLQDYATVIATGQVVVAESDGAIAGVLVLSTTPDGFLIENVAVLPELRGRGIGRGLLIRAEHEANARGHGSLYLYTNEKMVENIAMYVRNGYVEYARQEGQGFRRVFLRKQLEKTG
jgi:GNAT superfamily N-acetyltransferase